MAKRANGEGSVFQRATDGRWESRLFLPNGKRKFFYGRTRQEVAKKLTAALKARDDGLPIPSVVQTIEQYLSAWLKVIEPRLRPRSYIRYQDAVRLHLVPTLGKISLAKLTAQHLESLYAAKLKEGLAPATVQRMLFFTKLYMMLSGWGW